MIITKLTIANFGVYRSTQTFDLRPRLVDGETAPVVLFGGKNGAGKTTILEAIRLCLYGQLALGNRVRRTDYEEYVSRRLHRNEAGEAVANSAHITIGFEHVHVGVRSVYSATRGWRVDNQGVQESLLINRDGALLHDIAVDHWNDFLRDLIPPGLANLFFFDGEQIQALANDDTEADSLQEAVKGLLNLDLIDRLRGDLNLYLKQKGSKVRSELEIQAEEAEAIYQERAEERLHLVQDRAGLKTELAGIANRLEKARQELLREGAIFVQQQTEQKERLATVELELDETASAISDLATGLLPFAVAPQWSERLQQRLHTEAQLEQARLAHAAQAERAAAVALKLLDPTFQRQTAPSVPPQEWAQITSAVQQLLQPSTLDTTTPIRHQLSAQQRTTLNGWITQVLESIPQQIAQLTARLERLESEKSALHQALRQVPDEAVTTPLLEQFQALSQDEGRLQAELKRADDELNRLDYQMTELERMRKKAWQQLAEADDADIRVQRAAKVQVVLDAYLAEITALKLNELEQQIAYYFNLLCRKQMIVQEAHVDPKRFTVRLYGKNRVELPKFSLSAGEKQLYAMSLLWALRSVSGRNLPIIIDTPMGRLDSEHRQALLTRFFPGAANQIILLSTDTEINAEAYQQLKPVISHAFALEFDDAVGATQVRCGYFGDAVDGLALPNGHTTAERLTEMAA
ncbi:MAG: DNA sulfur modification protein DndD [Caldilineaceae bacterium]